MSEQAEARRMRMMELLAESGEPQGVDDLAFRLECDARTIRRDLDALQQLLSRVQGLEVRRGQVSIARAGYSPGYFTDQLDRHADAKLRIARAIVSSLNDDLALALTAGSTTYSVAQEIRRVSVEGGHPRNLIVFTNSVPSLLEMIAAGVSTGVLGEIYSPEDCAFHSPDHHSAFQPSLAIVGASGVWFGGSSSAASLDLFSHRAEEAAFLKQLLQDIPEIVIAADSHKLGKRHPWSFGGSVLNGKSVRLVTDSLTPQQAEIIAHEADAMKEHNIRFEVTVADNQILNGSSS